MPTAMAKPSDLVQRGQAFGGYTKFFFQVEGAAPTCQLDHVGDILNGVEAGLAALALDQPRNTPVEHVAAELREGSA